MAASENTCALDLIDFTLSLSSKISEALCSPKMSKNDMIICIGEYNADLMYNISSLRDVFLTSSSDTSKSPEQSGYINTSNNEDENTSNITTSGTNYQDRRIKSKHVSDSIVNKVADEPYLVTNSGKICQNESIKNVPFQDHVDDTTNIFTSERINNEKRAGNKEKFDSICKFYVRNKCKYAQPNTCKFRHPKKCHNIIKNGKCAKEKCDMFHPKICFSSRDKGVCFRENCQYLHIKGTVRKRPITETDDKNINNISDHTKKFSFLEDQIGTLINQVQLLSSMMKTNLSHLDSPGSVKNKVCSLHHFHDCQKLQ
ncbi:Uncharacterised protein r2_g4193 [Pycnogonum litorale]